MSRQAGIHPEISSLIRHKDEMWDQLQDKNYTAAHETMITILYDIRKEDAPQTLIDTINREIATLDSFENSSQRLQRLKQCRTLYYGWAHEITQVLWEKDYLVNKKYGVVTKLDTTFKARPWTETPEEE